MSDDLISIARHQNGIPATEAMLDKHECSKLLGVTANTLAQYRSRSYHGPAKGPRFIHMRGRIFYPMSWVQEYLNSREGV